MFEHFTFGAQARIQIEEEPLASPTDTSFPSPISLPPSSFPFQWEETQPELSYIVHQMSRQSLSHENEKPQQSIWQNTTASSPIVDFDDECDPFDFAELNFVSTTRGMATVKASYDSAPMTLQAPSGNGKVACRRVQRVRNTQMQSSSKHVKDINTLVEDMVENSSQCKLRKTTSRPYLTSPPPSRGGMDDYQHTLDPNPVYYENRSLTPDSEEDEGFADIDEFLAIKESVSLRRAGNSSGVRKNNNGLRYRGSAESIGNLRSGNGPLKVRSLPRMRKRPKETGAALRS